MKLAALAAWKAGVEILKIYADDFLVAYKEDTSPLTKADKLADLRIQEVLQPYGIPIISEETQQVDYAFRKNWEAYWLVDPLDGTKEFIDKNGEFTVNIAYVTKLQPEYAALYVPVSKELYLADVANKKVYLAILSEETKESDFADLENLIQELPAVDNSKFRAIGVSRSHLDAKTLSSVASLTKDTEVALVRMGSALKYAKLLTGELDLYFRFSPTMEWDNAAGHALCLAAGLEMYSLPDKHVLSYNSESLLSPHFAAGTSMGVKKLFESIKN